MSEIIYWSYVL